MDQIKESQDRDVLYRLQPGADWAAWQPDTCQVGRLVRWPGGPPRQMLKEGAERRRGPGTLS